MMRINHASSLQSLPAPDCERTEFTLASLGGVRHRGVLLHHDPGCFDMRFFAEWGIAVPNSVARSVSKRQADFFYGRLASRFAMQSLGIAGHSEIGIGAQRQPLWPETVTGSISHTQGVAAAVVAEATGAEHIGIDLEHLATPEAALALDRLVVNAAERVVLKTAFPNESSLGLTIAFSAKESFFKAAFPKVGRSFDFGAITLQQVDKAKRYLRFELATTLVPSLPAGKAILARYALILPNLIITDVYC